MTNEASKDTLPLVIPEGISYNCQGCGRCCAGWSIGMTQEDYENVKDVDWGALYPQLKGKEMVGHQEEEYKQGLSSYPHFTRANEDGSCRFLVDNLCIIHSYLGEPKKPRVCQLFPYTFTPTPGGIFVGLAYNSMAALRNAGKPLADQQAMLAGLWQTVLSQEKAHGRASQDLLAVAGSVKAADMSAVKYDVNLAAGQPLSWQDYLTVEKKLLEVVQSKESGNILHALLNGAEVTAEAVRLKANNLPLTKLEEFTSSINVWFKASPGMAENLVFKAIMFKGFEWPALRKKYGDQWENTKKNPLTESQVLNSAVRTIMGGQVFLPGVETVNLNKSRQYKIQPISQEIEDFYRRYLFLKIFSKTFCGPAFAGFSVVAGFNNLIGNIVGSIVYAKAHAMKRKETSLRLEDAHEAIFLIDRESNELSHLPKDRASFFDLGFSSPRLFNRLLGDLARTIEGATK